MLQGGGANWLRGWLLAVLLLLLSAGIWIARHAPLSCDYQFFKDDAGLGSDESSRGRWFVGCVDGLSGSAGLVDASPANDLAAAGRRGDDQHRGDGVLFGQGRFAF